MTDVQAAWLVAAVVYAGQIAGVMAGRQADDLPSDDKTVEEVQALAVKFHAALVDKWLVG